MRCKAALHVFVEELLPDGLGEINMADFQFLLAELEAIREAQNSKL